MTDFVHKKIATKNWIHLKEPWSKQADISSKTNLSIHFGIPNLKSLFIKFATHQNVSLNDVKYDVCIYNSFLFIYEIRGFQKSGQLLTDDNDNI